MAKNDVEKLPHSWRMDDWPDEVFPGNKSRARRLVYMHEDELIACGALTRIGRYKVILGAGFSVFLNKQSHRVKDFHIAPNRKHAASVETPGVASKTATSAAT
jgi:hypothetical protein